MKTLSRYVAREYLRAFFGTLVAICAIFLVVEYVDRARIYTGPGWQRAVLALYANKAITVFYQLAPAAMLLGAGITLAGLRRRGEFTAIKALAIGPWALLVPLTAVCLALVGGAMVADELLVGRASRRVDEINTTRFKSWGDWGQFFGENHWFRGKRHVYHLRSGGPDEGFENVTVYTLSDDFRLAKRLDARRMLPAGGRAWRFVDGSRREFVAGQSKFERFDERVIELDEDPRSFRIAKGRPEQMGLRELREQIGLRQNVGLPAERYLMAAHNKLAYPLGGLPGMLLACALALRPGRRGRLASVMAEGFLIIVGIWGLLVIFKAAAFAGYVSAALAAWAPVMVLSALAAIALKRFVR